MLWLKSRDKHGKKTAQIMTFHGCNKRFSFTGIGHGHKSQFQQGGGKTHRHHS
jgi:hypothetical protein